jgi:hypothetical protein
MGTTEFNFSEPGLLPIPLALDSGPDSDTKTEVPAEEPAPLDTGIVDAPDDGGSGPDSDTKTQ